MTQRPGPSGSDGSPGPNQSALEHGGEAWGDRRGVRRLGLEAGRIEIMDDFDAPLPEELLAAFEGRSAEEGDPLLGA